MKEKNKITTISVKPEVHTKLRILTAVTNKTGGELIDEMITEYVKNRNIKITGIFE